MRMGCWIVQCPSKGADPFDASYLNIEVMLWEWLWLCVGRCSESVGSCGGVGGAVDHSSKRELYEQGEWGGTRRKAAESGSIACEQGDARFLGGFVRSIYV